MSEHTIREALSYLPEGEERIMDQALTALDALVGEAAALREALRAYATRHHGLSDGAHRYHTFAECPNPDCREAREALGVSDPRVRSVPELRGDDGGGNEPSRGSGVVPAQPAENDSHDAIAEAIEVVRDVQRGASSGGETQR